MEILKEFSTYKITAIALFLEQIEELSAYGIEHKLVYKLILKCHEKYYELSMETNKSHIMYNYKPEKIEDIKQYLKEEMKRCDKMCDLNTNISRELRVLYCDGFKYSCDEEAFLYFDANVFPLRRVI